MTVAIFGGTGKTGRLIVAQALKAGHRVRVLARDPDKIAPIFGLELIKGDMTDGGRVMATMVGCESVVVALGPVKGGPVNVCSLGTELILQAARKVGTRKLSVITSLGVGDSRKEVPWVFRIYASLFLKPLMEDKERQESLVRASGLDWTLIRPTGLTDLPPSGLAWSGPGKMAASLPAGRRPKGRVSRGDVADLVVKSLTDPLYSCGAWFITE